MAFKNVLLALNGVDEETLVIQKAIELKEAFGANLSILHVNDPDAGQIHMMMSSYPKVTREDLLALIEKAGHASSLSNSKIEILVDEDPIKSIAKLSANYDLIIMGHHKKNGLMARFTGGTDERVADSSKCPVLTIPIQEESFI